MKHLKPYGLFESQERKELTEEQKDFLTKHTNGVWMFDHNTGLVDVKGDFDCVNEKVSDFLGIKFGKVAGSFICSQNKLTSLAGAPQEVGLDFSCSYNPIGSLAGAPQKVGSDFSAEANSLASLLGGPQEVGGDYNCRRNDLTSLEGAARKVSGTFNCSRNPLTSLEGAPEEVGIWFACDAFVTTTGEWNMEGWIEMFDKGNDEVKQLILSLLSAEEINKRIAQDPAGMVMMLKRVWNSERFRDVRNQLIWPEGFERSMQRAGGLADLGL